MRHRLPILIVQVLGAALLVACAARSPEPTVAPREEHVPKTLIATLDGAPTDLSVFLQGRPALVNFWATWCDACMNEMGALNRLGAEVNAEGGGSGGLVVGVAVGEPRETVLAFTRRHRFEYAQLVDEDFHLADALGERRVPSTLVVDRDGRIVFRGAGLDRDALAAFRRAAAGGGGPLSLNRR